MNKQPGFYCYDPVNYKFLNGGQGLQCSSDWDHAQPLRSIEECQKIKDQLPELEFYYLPEPGNANQDLVAVPLFPAPDHEVITEA